jgi:hypothetical protein
MPNLKIERQTISVDVLFEAGDHFRDRASGAILVLVRVGNSRAVLVDKHKSKAVTGLLQVEWAAQPNSRQKCIRLSEMADAIVEGATITDFLMTYTFEGSKIVEQAVQEMPVV